MSQRKIRLAHSNTNIQPTMPHSQDLKLHYHRQKEQKLKQNMETSLEFALYLQQMQSQQATSIFIDQQNSQKFSQNLSSTNGQNQFKFCNLQQKNGPQIHKETPKKVINLICPRCRLQQSQFSNIFLKQRLEKIEEDAGYFQYQIEEISETFREEINKANKQFQNMIRQLMEKVEVILQKKEKQTTFWKQKLMQSQKEKEWVQKQVQLYKLKYKKLLLEQSKLQNDFKLVWDEKERIKQQWKENQIIKSSRTHLNSSSEKSEIDGPNNDQLSMTLEVKSTGPQSRVNYISPPKCDLEMRTKVEELKSKISKLKTQITK